MIVDIIKKVVPSGKFRNFLATNYQLFNILNNLSGDGYDLNFSMLDKAIILDFNKDVLSGQRLIFPIKQIKNIVSITRELPTYMTSFNYLDNPSNSIIIDAGAFLGEFGIISERLHKPKKIFAMEPDPINREYFKEFLYLNAPKSNIELLNYALSGCSGENRLISAGQGSKMSEFYDGLKTKSIPVETITLDNLLRCFNNKDILVKMDIEGSEINAMFGSVNSVKNNTMTFAIAAYHEVDGIQTYKKLEEFFSKINYNTKLVNEEHLTLMAYK